MATKTGIVRRVGVGAARGVAGRQAKGPEVSSLQAPAEGWWGGEGRRVEEDIPAFWKGA